MRRAAILISLIAVLVTGLVVAASAPAAEPGFNLPTKRLEGAYKFALQDRRFDPAGCYAPPSELSGILTRATGRTVGVARGTGGLRKLNRVYVLKSGTNCNRLRMALRAVGGIYVLDSHLGTVRIQGRKGAATPGLARTLSGFTLATQTYRLNKPDTAPRLEVMCAGGKSPLGGGMTQSPGVGADGDGIYPHSYERLGAQLGYHISVVVLDPSPAQTTTRTVTMQTVCGRGVIPATPTPHKTVWVRSGQTKTVTARCPKGQFLVSGGFQRTNFRSDGGDYITQSRAAGPKAWTVSGSAYGPTGQGELTAIAYCARMKKPMLTEVRSGPVPVGANQVGSSTTSACPKGKRLVAGGFSSGGSSNAFFAEGQMNSNSSFTARSFGFFGPVSNLTSYGYCWPSK
ncbi:MAG TPA: hypothetical protein VHR38_08610 [Solirubrobacterales bacterium]|jgi:hypothetical protein|nr:hypothetical protein [Solirubrobacterales bacterium]